MFLRMSTNIMAVLFHQVNYFYYFSLSRNKSFCFVMFCLRNNNSYSFVNTMLEGKVITTGTKTVDIASLNIQ